MVWLNSVLRFSQFHRLRIPRRTLPDNGMADTPSASAPGFESPRRSPPTRVRRRKAAPVFVSFLTSAATRSRLYILVPGALSWLLFLLPVCPTATPLLNLPSAIGRPKPAAKAQTEALETVSLLSTHTPETGMESRNKPAVTSVATQTAPTQPRAKLSLQRIVLLRARPSRNGGQQVPGLRDGPVPITDAGLAAAAHQEGARTVRRYLDHRSANSPAPASIPGRRGDLSRFNEVERRLRAFAATPYQRLIP